MPCCSNSEASAAKAAASIEDVIAFATAGESGFDGLRRVAETLRGFEPRLVCLAFPDQSTVPLNRQCGEEEVRWIEEAASRFVDLEPGQTRSLRVASKGGQAIVRAAALLPDASRGILLCVYDEAGGFDSAEIPSESAMLAGLTCRVATDEVDTVSLRTRVEQLTAEHEALRASYTRSLTQAVEERDERLREQQEHTSRLQAIMMAAAEGIVTIDEKGSIESFNSAATEIFRYAPEEVIGLDVSILFPDALRNDEDVFWDSIPSHGKAGRRASCHELQGRRKDGSAFPLEISISHVALQDRILTTAILRDITQRKEAERELRRLHLFNRMVLDSAGEGIVGLDREGRVAFANPAAEQLFGRKVATLVGLSLHSLTHHSRLNGAPYPWHDCPIYRAVSEGADHREDGEVFWREDGTNFPVEYVATPMREEGEIIGAVLTFRDISQRRTLEGQLVQAQKLESIGQLAAGIAHEINTPTQFIGDNLRFLKEGFDELKPALAAFEQRVRHATASGDQAPTPGDMSRTPDSDDLAYLLEEVPRAIYQSLEGVERVATIVRSMKEFSHPGSDEMQTVDLNRAIESTLTVCRNEWKYVADVVTDFDPDLPLVTCLPGECNQVFLNLIINASHAIAEAGRNNGDAKGTITVQTRSVPEAVEIRITDTGTGISADHRGKLFDPFFTTKEVGRGTGQGLAIARSVVVEKHGGAIWFESELGHGTTFIVQLPIGTT